MRYARFKVTNFRGIRKAEVSLSAATAGRVSTIVGLNESGKTTLLEAINSFQPDQSISTLTNAADLSQRLETLIPKHEELNFNGDIEIAALIELSDEDVGSIARDINSELKLELLHDGVPRSFWIRKAHRFKLSKHVSSILEWDCNFQVRPWGKRKFRDASEEELSSIQAYLLGRLPLIRYYPTFLFDVPENIWLNADLTKDKNLLYRRIFMDILSRVDGSLTLQDHIIGRIQPQSSSSLPFINVFQNYVASSERRRVEAIFARMSALTTRIVMGRWNQVFKDKISDKEVVIEPDIVKSSNSETAIVSAKFLIKDGTDTYRISERSLGFKWFFCFLLFTQFQNEEADSRNILYLFDEPASTLHARAQAQLLDSFGLIASGGNALIYSTHSHHMINPDWLESAYIVENAAVSYDEHEFQDSWNRRHTEVRVTPYRRFVGSFPERVSYFQPVLEALNYAPSNLEGIRPAVLVEGKSDFYVLKYLSEMLFPSINLSFLPGVSADRLGPLISLYLGWGKQFIVLLDNDAAGARAKAAYVERFGLSDEVVLTIESIFPWARNLEGLLSPAMYDIISQHFELTERPSKKHVLHFFQEMLGARKAINMPAADAKRLEDGFYKLEQMLSNPHPSSAPR